MDGTKPARSNILMQPTVTNATDTPVIAHEDYRNHVVIMTGLGKFRGQTHFVIASSKQAPQAALSAQNLIGENFVPAIALDGTALRELMDALDGVQIEPNQAVNMTGDEVIAFSRK